MAQSLVRLLSSNLRILVSRHQLWLAIPPAARVWDWVFVRPYRWLGTFIGC
jgi:hypothetical protein